MMIATLVENIAKCLARFPAPGNGAAKSALHVLFLGSEDNAALLQSFFAADGWQFKHEPFLPGTDPAAGLPPHADGAYSLVVCAPLGEQDGRLWLERLRSTLSPSGLLLCAFPAAGSSQQPPTGPVPFNKTLNTLASDARLVLVDSWVDNKGPWHEFVGIFQRNDAIARQPVQDVKLYPQATLSPGSATPPADTKAKAHDVVRPGIGYQQVLETVLRMADARRGMRVLDLGTGTGNLAASFVALVMNNTSTSLNSLPFRIEPKSIISSAFSKAFIRR